MSEVVYQKGESRIEAEKNPTTNTKNLILISLFIFVVTAYFTLPGCYTMCMSVAQPYEQPSVVGCLVVFALIEFAMSYVAALIFGGSWVACGQHIYLCSSTGTTATIPLSPTSPNPCEEPEFKAAYTKAINEMKAEIDKIEAERAEKNARRDACVASLKEMAK